MKKLIFLICLLLLVSACSKDDQVVLESTIKTYDYDFSIYQNMSSTSEYIKAISPKEFYDAYNNSGSGIFLISSSTCSYCQIAMSKIEESAKNTNNIVYYIDTDSEYYPFIEYSLDIKEILDEYLIIDENSGIKELYLPHIFVMVNGKIVNSHIGLLDYEYSEDDSDKLIDIYNNIMKEYKD